MPLTAPARATWWVRAARASRRVGARDAAARCCERALDLNPADKGASQLLRSLFFHGDRYHQVLEQVHRLLQPRTYLEIGVAAGDTLRCVQPGTLAIGIDPQPRVKDPLPDNIRVFPETSDAFFARRDVRARFGGLPIDLAFIDGLHHFDAVLRDFANVERLCHPRSVVLVHDCLPWTRKTSSRTCSTLLWTGDVWRALVLLKKYRPDLSIHTIATPPTGLGVVTGLDPASRVLADRLADLFVEGMVLDFSYLAANRAAKLSLVENSQATIRRLIGLEPTHDGVGRS